MFDRLRNFQGQVIAYGGGTLVSLWSQAVSAVEHIPEMTADMTTNDVIGIGGLVVIAGRLVFDVVVYIDTRKQRRKGQQEE